MGSSKQKTVPFSSSAETEAALGRMRGAGIEAALVGRVVMNSVPFFSLSSLSFSSSLARRLLPALAVPLLTVPAAVPEHAPAVAAVPRTGPTVPPGDGL